MIISAYIKSWKLYNTNTWTNTISERKLLSIAELLPPRVHFSSHDVLCKYRSWKTTLLSADGFLKISIFLMHQQVKVAAENGNDDAAQKQQEQQQKMSTKHSRNKSLSFRRGPFAVTLE